MPKAIVKAAVVQAAPVMFDTDRTLAKLAELAREAAAQQADIVVFPEAFVGGYPKGLDFGARLGSRSPEGREDFRRYYEARSSFQAHKASCWPRQRATIDCISSSVSSSAAARRSIAPR